LIVKFWLALPCMLKTVQGGPGVPLQVHRRKLYPQTHPQRTTSPGKAPVPSAYLEPDVQVSSGFLGVG